MYIPEDVASFCSEIGKFETNFNNEVPNAINAFINKQNEIWCSQSAQAFANEVKDVLDADLKAIVGAMNTIDCTLEINANRYKSIEGDDPLYTKHELTVPNNWTASLANMNKTLQGGYVGLAENATVGDLESLFDQIVVALGNLITGVATANKQLNAFGPTEKSNWDSELLALKNNIDSGLSSLKDSLKTRVANEDRTRNELKNANEQNISGIGDSISMG